ncbi:Isoleucine--tRNA ligase [Trichinella pseudospiralis]
MLRAGVNQASVAKVPFTTMTERRSRAMAAVNFIKGFQSELEDEMKILNIKVDGVLSSTLEGYYLQIASSAFTGRPKRRERMEIPIHVKDRRKVQRNGGSIT